MPYIASLGVDLVWFNPFFPSPQRDNGYDVADYCAIDPAMGTMADFDELVAALDGYGIGVMLDMVLNHTSTAHEWFQKALAGDEKYRASYYLRPGQRTGRSRRTGCRSSVAPPGRRSATPACTTCGLYQTQADLDWHNPEVRAEMASVVNFWRRRGVRGFRFDVINLIGKGAELVDAPAGTDDRFVYTDGPDDRFVYTDGPDVHTSCRS